MSLVVLGKVDDAAPERRHVRPRRPRNLGDRVFDLSLSVAALMIPALVALFVGVLIYGAWPSIRAFGWEFLVTKTWNPNPNREQYGALVFIFGTLVSSIVALCLAAPIGIAVAALLNEVVTAKVRVVLSFVIEILATIPSVVYGLWGIFVLAPWVRQVLQPFLSRTLGFLPLFQGPQYGLGMLAAILILAIMVLPIIVSVSNDAMRGVPVGYREAALALGATRWEMIRLAVLPPARTGIMGGCILAMARALGETMAITMVIGNGHEISWSLFAASDTVASAIANQFSEATSDLYSAALIELALLLFVVTLVVNFMARLIISGLGQATGGTP